MFKIISAVFTTGFAVGAASAFLAVHRGHIELEANQPESSETDDDTTDDATAGAEGDDPNTTNDGGNGSGQTSDADDPVTIHSAGLGF